MEVSGCCSVQGRPVSSAGCSEPEQSCPGLARQALHCSSMKSPCCVCNVHRHQVSWGFMVQSVFTKAQILLYPHSVKPLNYIQNMFPF